MNTEAKLIVPSSSSKHINMQQAFGTNVASPADKDVKFNCAKQIQLTNMRASEAPSRRRGASLTFGFARHS